MSALWVAECRFVRLGLLFAMVMLAGSCTQKAKLIQTGAAQFEAQSLATIEKIDEVRRKETQVSPTAPEQATQMFIDAVKASTKPISREMLVFFLNPHELKLLKTEASWQGFVAKLRNQYATFASMFASLEKGSLLGASRVKEAVPLLDKLIAQMAAFSKSLCDHPAEFTRERAAIADDLEAVRDTKPYDKATDLRLKDLEKRLREVAAAEEQVTRNAVEEALKAVKLGQQLRKLLVEYETITVGDIAEALSVAFRLASGIPGLDLSSLQAQTNEVIQEIQANPSQRLFLEEALRGIMMARQAI